MTGGEWPLDGGRLAALDCAGRLVTLPSPEGLDPLELRIFEGLPAQFPGSDSGCVIWDAAEPLSRHVFGRARELAAAGAGALELGCGCALVSLALASAGVECVATDGCESVLADVSAVNVAVNARALRAPIHLQTLRWGDPAAASKAAARLSTPTGLGLVVGSDVLYDDTAGLLLGETLRALKASSDPSLFHVILAAQVRREEIERSSILQIEAASGLAFDVIAEEPVEDLFSDGGGSVVRIYEGRSSGAAP